MRKRYILLIIILLFLVIGPVRCGVSRHMMESDIKQYGINNATKLSKIAEQLLHGDMNVEEALYLTKKRVSDISVQTENESVEFMCDATGIVPSGTYYGLFYSSKDDIHSLYWWRSGDYSEFEPDGKGYFSVELYEDGTEGDNQIYVEHLTGHLYYYWASY